MALRPQVPHPRDRYILRVRNRCVTNNKRPEFHKQVTASNIGTGIGRFDTPKQYYGTCVLLSDGSEARLVLLRKASF
jgi:hypothetical protein